MDLRTVRILVVDDHQAMRDILRALLYGLGARQVAEATSAKAALEHLMLNPVGLLLADHDLGGTSGVELIRTVRREPSCRNRKVPIVMVSGRAEPAVILAARDAGVDEFLVKPLTPAGLVRKLSLALEGRRPFVETGGYVGPERRLRLARAPAAHDRRRPQASRHA